MANIIEHGPLAPILADHVVVQNKLLNDMVNSINDLIEDANSKALEIEAMKVKIAQITEDVSSLAKIVEEIYNET